MSWATPITWVTGDLVTSGRLNAMLNDNMQWLRGNGTQGRENMRMSGVVNPILPGVNGSAVFGTVIWDATGYLSTWEALGGGTPPWDYIPEPAGINLLSARVTAITGGTLANSSWFESTTGEVPDLTNGTVPTVAGVAFQMTLTALHRYTANQVRVRVLHGGVSGSAQAVPVTLELANMLSA